MYVCVCTYESGQHSLSPVVVTVAANFLDANSPVLTIAKFLLLPAIGLHIKWLLLLRLLLAFCFNCI